MAKSKGRKTKKAKEKGTKGRANKLALALLLTFALFTFAGLGAGWGAWQNLCVDCPSIAQITTWEPEQTSKLYSHDGRLIAELGLERRTPIPIEALPPHVPQAFLAIEDRHFYQHHGYSIRGILRAALVRLPGGQLLGRRAGGGSTITQQLARNMFTQTIGFEKRITRKLKELQVALALERTYTKDQILQAYINQINYDRGWYGIQTASRNYFGKNATELNPAEAAMLAAIPNRPAYYNPIRNPENGRQRRNLVLDLMGREGFLTREEVEEWKAWPLPEGHVEARGGEAPYFQEWVRQMLDDRFGEQLYTGGLRIYTTLDLDMQHAAELSMEEGWARIEARPGYDHPLYEEFADSTEPFDTPYVQGMFIALDPHTGGVRAMVGGRDFRHSKFNRATQAMRQAGSSFKPFVYTSALASGIPASHIIVDAPVVLPQVSGEEWKPQNFTEEFQGPITIREGLRRSINMIAIKLGMEVGLETVAQTAQRMGIRTEIERYESTAIGAAEVIPLQMAEAYSTFATLGTRVRPNPILRVVSAEGTVLWEPQPERTQVLDSLATRIMVSMLEDVVAQGTGYNAIRVIAGLPYEIPAAGKTGTTNDGTNVWFMGVTPNLTAAVWFGMDMPVTIREGATGGGDAAPVWGAFMKRVYYSDSTQVNPDSVRAARGIGVIPGALSRAEADSSETEGLDPAEVPAMEDTAPIRGYLLPIPEPWPIPVGIITREVDSKTGLLASRWCPAEQAYTELYIPGTEPTDYCDRSGPRIFRRVPEPSPDRPPVPSSPGPRRR